MLSIILLIHFTADRNNSEVQIKQAQLPKKSSSSKSSGHSSRSGGNTPTYVANYGSMSYAPATPISYDDNSKYFKLLQEFGKGYRFTKCGSECHILSQAGVDSLISFPYTKKHIRNACFLFLNGENFEKLKDSLFDDYSLTDSPPEFKMFD